MRVGNQNSCDELRSHHAALLVSDSPAGVELDVGIKQGNNWGSGSPPPAHSGADQTLLLGVAHHLNKSWVFTVGLRHKILQLLLEFACNTRTQTETHTHAPLRINIRRVFVRDVSEHKERANFRPQDTVMSSSSGQYFIGRRPNALMFRRFDHWTKEAAARVSAADLRGAHQS